MKYTNLTKGQIDYLNNNPSIPNSDCKTDEEQWRKNSEVIADKVIDLVDEAIGDFLAGYEE